MLDGWHEFYGLLGTAAAALVALLFVAASIGAGYLSAERRSATRTFTSPIVFHYTYVLFLSLAALVPINTDRSLAALIGVSAAIALVYSFFILAGVMRSATRDLDDRLAYGATPIAAYLAALAASVFIFERSRSRPAAVGRRAGSFAAGQYPQRLGSDRIFCAAAHRQPFAAACSPHDST